MASPTGGNAVPDANLGGGPPHVTPARYAAWWGAAVGAGGAFYLLSGGMSDTARWVAALVGFGMVLWVSETLPLFATALIVSLLLVVPGGFAIDAVFASYFDPAVVLIFGGFVMGVALQKHGLDRYLADLILSRTGERPAAVLLGFMALSAGFSMWITNTAACAILLPIALGVVVSNGLTPGSSRYGKALVLGIAYGATIGGISTPVGSTPNPLAVRFLADAGTPITFLDWVVKLAPLAALMVLSAAAVLLWLYRPEVERVKRDPTHPRLDRRMVGVMAVFFVTVALWLTTGIHGVSAAAVSMVPVAALFATRLLDEHDILRVDWGTLLLIGGSLALGQAVVSSGLADAMGVFLADGLGGLPVVAVFFLVTMFAIALTVFTSNTAAAAILIPIVIPLAAVLSVPATPLVLLVMAGVSMDFLVPVGTPPNAMAYATKAVRVKDMVRAGTPLVVIAGVLATGAALAYW
jgi:sodium-dependent dicarboxylate transporter 2/3/5